VDRLDNVYFPVDLKGNASAEWVRGQWLTHFQVNYTSSYEDKISGACVLTACAVASWTTVDAAVTYFGSHDAGLAQGLDLGLSVQNLFDRDPPYARSPFNLGYDPSHANPLGRVLSLSLRKRW
jgi:outer membrane receptor protein involved in Fe transport